MRAKGFWLAVSLVAARSAVVAGAANPGENVNVLWLVTAVAACIWLPAGFAGPSWLPWSSPRALGDMIHTWYGYLSVTRPVATSEVLEYEEAA